MESLQISLPESMKEFIESQVAKGGHSTASEYVQKLVRDAQTEVAADAVEGKVLEAFESPSTPMTAQDWSEIRRQVQQRHAERRPA